MMDWSQKHIICYLYFIQRIWNFVDKFNGEIRTSLSEIVTCNSEYLKQATLSAAVLHTPDITTICKFLVWLYMYSTFIQKGGRLGSSGPQVRFSKVTMEARGPMSHRIWYSTSISFTEKKLCYLDTLRLYIKWAKIIIALCYLTFFF